MPREVTPLPPTRDRARSLGWLALAWIEHLVRHGPGDVQGEPVVHGQEYSDFVADCYCLDERGRRLFDSSFLSRPKGCDKSGMAARLVLFESLGPCRFAGWARGGETYSDPWGLGFTYTYQPGEPMGRHVRAPFVRIMATEEGQAGNTYDTVHFNLTNDECPLSAVPGLDPGLKRTILPGGGEIRPSTSSNASKDGGIETFVVFDETHLYNLPDLRSAYATVARNLRKRKRIAETWYLETTTMFAAGEDSIAEQTYQLAGLVREGKVKKPRLLFDHRYGECEDLSDERALRAALVEAFGDAIAWNDLDGLVDGVNDPRSTTVASRRYFLNSPESSQDAWIAGYEWAARLDVTQVVADRETITLGFDGSRKRVEGVTDATALVGCRVSDGHVFEIEVWEQPSGFAGNDWEVPVVAVDAVVRDTFRRYNVVGFFADPARWETQVAAWEAAYGGRLKVKASTKHPCEWWMTGGRLPWVVNALRAFYDAIIDGDMTHDGSSALTRHVLNARRRPTTQGVTIAKEHPESERKIDAAVAAVLAWQARLEAVAKGLHKTNRGVPRRVR